MAEKESEDQSKNNIEEVIDRKVDRKIERYRKEVEDLKKENRALKQKINESEVQELDNPDSNKSQDNENQISRRSFLKKIGIGAAGIGALSLSPAASQLKITKDGVSNLNKINGQNFNGFGGDVSDPMSSNLDGGSNEINNLSKLVADHVSPQSQLEVPTNRPSQDNRLWVENGELRVKISGSIKKAKLGSPSLKQWKIVENFEHNNLGNNYSGDTGQFTIVSGTNYEGSYSLRADGYSLASSISTVSSPPDLPKTVWPRLGEPIKLWIKESSNGFTKLEIYTSTGNGRIKLRTSGRDNIFYIEYFGASNNLSPNIPTDKWLLWHVEPSGSSYESATFTLYDGATTSDPEIQSDTLTASTSDLPDQTENLNDMVWGDGDSSTYYDKLQVYTDR